MSFQRVDNIASARWQDPEQSGVIVNGKHAIPADEGNKQWQLLQAWVAAGGVIEAYQAPPPPTAAERIDQAFRRSDSARVIFEALFEQANAIRALEGKPAIDRQQYKQHLKEFLP